jgi:predicted glycoside hydrolase/deacetylase ChbG (UPF0249 family)
MRNEHYLIISADDFGLVPSVTEGILEGLSKGCITETNYIATSDYCVEAAKSAKMNRINHMGIHLNLEIGHSCYDGSKLPNKMIVIGTSEYYEWVEKEFFSQCEYLLNQGLVLTHLTYHKNIIIDYKMAKIIVRIAQFYDVPVRRVSDERINNYLANTGIKMTDRRIANDPGIDYSINYLYKKLKINRNDEKGSIVEVICHPGYLSKELSEVSSLNRSRLKELKLFTDSQTICMIRKEGYKLKNYSILGEK